MSLKLLIVLSFMLVAVQAEKPSLGFRMPTLGLGPIKPHLGLGVPTLGLGYINGRINGGVEAERGEFPHQVTLQWGLPPAAPHSHFCGGIILRDKWILTAGHCVLAVPAYGEFVVKAGKHNIKATESTEQIVEVEASWVHEKYAGGVAPYDIALLKLKSSLKFNDIVNPIRLPKSGSKPTGNSILSGWGAKDPYGMTMPPTLQKAELPIVDFDTCKAAIEALVGPSPLHVTNVCTGPLTGGVSACSGDSGGPLIAAGGSEVIGIVSWGITPCGTRGAPSVYTEVASFVSWIEATIKKN